MNDINKNPIIDKRWAVAGFTYEQAAKIIDDIESQCGKIVSKKRKSSVCICAYFTDETTLQWVPARESSRGAKCGKLWCDRNINKEIFNCIIRPCYYGKTEDIIWI